MDKKNLEKTLAACLADCSGLRGKKYRLPFTCGAIGKGTLREVFCDVDLETSSVTDARVYVYGEPLERCDYEAKGPICITGSIELYYGGIVSWAEMLEDAVDHMVKVLARREGRLPE